jgi:hypothetical protein
MLGMHVVNHRREPLAQVCKSRGNFISRVTIKRGFATNTVIKADAKTSLNLEKISLETSTSSK